MDDLTERVSPRYVDWLRLVADGAREDEIARRLEIPPEALRSFASLAARKLIRGGARPHPDHGVARRDSRGEEDA